MTGDLGYWLLKEFEITWFNCKSWQLVRPSNGLFCDNRGQVLIHLYHSSEVTIKHFELLESLRCITDITREMRLQLINTREMIISFVKNVKHCEHVTFIYPAKSGLRQIKVKFYLKENVVVFWIEWKTFFSNSFDDFFLDYMQPRRSTAKISPRIKMIWKEEAKYLTRKDISHWTRLTNIKKYRN